MAKLNPMRDKNEGMYSGGKGKTPVTKVFVQKVAEGTTSDGLSWRVKVMAKK